MGRKLNYEGKDNATCKLCGCEKPIQEFYTFKRKRGTIYNSSICRDCKRARERQRYHTRKSEQYVTSPRLYRRGADIAVASPILKVEGTTVYAKLFLYTDQGWTNDWHPIRRLSTTAECNQFMSVAATMPVSALKELARSYEIFRRSE